MITENPAFDSLLRPESIPAELKAIPRWLLWKLETRDGKPTKTPYQACGTLAKVNDPSTWTDFDTALAAYLKGGFSGIGIVLTDDDDLVGIDLDKCLNPVTGELEPDAAAIVAELPTYCEVSPSGRGLRLFGFGTLPQGGRRKGHVEMYESGRYLTVTGNRFNGHAALAHITPELAAVHARIFAKPDPVDTKPGKAEPPNLDDAELLDKARRARNGAEFDRLWSGDTSGQGGDASAADLALCNLLAFWTGNDPARMDRLFRQSGLFRPAKWDKVHYSDGRTYGQATVAKAIEGNRETYDGHRPGPAPVASKAEGRGASAVRCAIEQAGQPAKAERPEATADRPVTIRCIPGELPEMVDRAEAALCKHEANFYQRSGQLVRWCVSHAETVRGISRPGGAVIILAMDADYLLDRLNRRISWERWNEEKEDYVPCNAPRTVASTLLARRGLWRAQPLVAAINAPTLRPDGSILDKPGYDAATGLLFVNTAVDFPPIPQQPTYEHAKAALAFLYQEALSGFPFARAHDKSAALSSILTACVRHALKNAPMHTYNAPVMASGKSLLADVVALIATGHPATVMSYTPDGDEMRKRVLSVLMQGDLVVNLDNVEEPLASQTLCTVLTQEAFTDRILGVNKTGTAPTLCCWIATGNNLVVAGDLTTRIVPCNLDPQVERPEEREFSRNLYDWIPANRPALVQAVLTVLRGYIVAGRPKQPIKNFARFEDWSGLVRAALVWLGEADPLTGREQLEDGDPVRVKLRALLLAWFETFRTAPATSKEAVLRANETKLDDEGREQPAYPVLREALEEHFADKGGKVSSRYLGEFLKKYAGRVDMGARFENAGNYGTRVLWRIVVVDKARWGKFTDLRESTAQTARTAKPGGDHNEKRESVESRKASSSVQSVQSMQSVPPGPQKTPEKFSVAADDFSSHPPAESPPTDRNAPLPPTASSDNKERF